MKLQEKNNLLKKLYKLLLIIDRCTIIKLKDKHYLKIMYRCETNKKLDLDNPKTFNEKLQWLKLYNRNQMYTKMVDKHDAKEYAEKIIGNKYIISTIGVYEKFEDIDFDKLPSEFVIKCTHDSGNVVVCKDKNELDILSTKKKINAGLKRNYYYFAREWPYKDIKPRIIIEKLIENEDGTDIKDYKLFCFNGKVETILVCSNRKGNYKNTNFYNTNWELMPFTRENHTNTKEEISKPKNLDEMIQIGKLLSKDIPFVRVDLYEINGSIYFGELTFFPSAGFEGFKPESWDEKLGDMLILPNYKVEE